MFPNLLCGIYMYFDRSQELRTDCVQFWRSLSQLQMEAFKPMVIVGYSCSRKEPGTGVWRSEILSFQTETRTHREKLVQLTCGGYLLCVRPNAVS